MTGKGRGWWRWGGAAALFLCRCPSALHPFPSLPRLPRQSRRARGQRGFLPPTATPAPPVRRPKLDLGPVPNAVRGAGGRVADDGRSQDGSGRRAAPLPFCPCAHLFRHTRAPPRVSRRARRRRCFPPPSAPAPPVRRQPPPLHRHTRAHLFRHTRALPRVSRRARHWRCFLPPAVAAPPVCRPKLDLGPMPNVVRSAGGPSCRQRLFAGRLGTPRRRPPPLGPQIKFGATDLWRARGRWCARRDTRGGARV